VCVGGGGGGGGSELPEPWSWSLQTLAELSWAWRPQHALRAAWSV